MIIGSCQTRNCTVGIWDNAMSQKKFTALGGSAKKGLFSLLLLLRPQRLLNIMSQCWRNVEERTTTTFFVFCQLLPLTCLIETICNHHSHHFFWFITNNISTVLLLCTSSHIASSQMRQSKSRSTYFSCCLLNLHWFIKLLITDPLR